MGNIPTVENCICGCHPAVISGHRRYGDEVKDVWRVECPNCMNKDSWAFTKLKAVQVWNYDIKCLREQRERFG